LTQNWFRTTQHFENVLYKGCQIEKSRLIASYVSIIYIIQYITFLGCQINRDYWHITQKSLCFGVYNTFKIGYLIKKNSVIIIVFTIVMEIVLKWQKS